MEDQIQPNIPPVAPPQVPVLPLKNWSKILLFTILGLIVVAGAVFIGIQIGKSQTASQQTITVQPTVSQNSTMVSPTILPTETIVSPSEISDWKSYTNSVLKYSFKYPKDFKLTEESSNSVRVSNNLPPDPNCKGGGCNLEIPRLTIYFEHLDNPGEDTLNLDEFAQQIRNRSLSFNNEQGPIQTLQKYGYVMKYFDGITEGYNHTYCLKLNKETSFVITAVFPSREEAIKYTELETQILSTFKIAN